MKRLTLAFENQEIALCYPESLQRDIQRLFANIEPAIRSPRRTLVVQEHSEHFSIHRDGTPTFSGISRNDCLLLLLGEVVQALITDLDSGVALHAGAVMCGDRGLLLPGGTGAGKSHLTAWLADKGFSYLTDECVVLRALVPYFSALSRPVIIKNQVGTKNAEIARMSSASIVAGSNSIFWPGNVAASCHPQSCQLIVSPRFEEGSQLGIKALSPAEAAMELTACNVNARNLPDHGFGIVTSFAYCVPAIIIRYGNFEQLEGTFDTLLRLIAESRLSSHSLRQLLTLFKP